VFAPADDRKQSKPLVSRNSMFYYTLVRRLALSRVYGSVTNNNGFWIGFIDHSQVVTKNDNNSIADAHTTNSSKLSLLSQFSLDVSW
jgi:hypothetical protein